MKFLNSVQLNVIFAFLIMILSLIIGQLPEIPDRIGFGGFIPIFTPIVNFALTLIAYFISKVFIKKFNWIIIIIAHFGAFMKPLKGICIIKI